MQYNTLFCLRNSLVGIDTAEVECRFISRNTSSLCPYEGPRVGRLSESDTNVAPGRYMDQIEVDMVPHLFDHSFKLALLIVVST